MRSVFLSSFILLLTLNLSAQTKIVNTPKELKAAVTSAKPGERIILAKGEWKDAELVLHGRGTAKDPIVITAETAGSVLLTGSSSLKISGEYLVVKDLHFTNGYVKDGDVISFRTGSDKLANNCRITGVVIDNFSQPEKFKNDNWVVLYGKNNRVDHCTFVNKLNAGPTLIVELNDERSQQNNHSIDSNYFKGRQRLGSNGGETIRVGVSKYSLTPSKTNIKHNYFERCNGEVEIISIKSGDNQISFNTFFECEGSLVLRHGSNNVVEGNLFVGNHKDFTGGVRVINPGHKVFNNVFKDLKGEDFRSALAVMNGVPNSLINRYHQVKDADIHHNTFINCANIEFGVGKDAERTAAPENVQFRNNLLVNSSDPVYVDNNNSGIQFSSNLLVKPTGKSFPAGFKVSKASIKTFNGIELPNPVANNGANPAKLPLIKMEKTGASWYKPESTSTKVRGRRYNLSIADAGKFLQFVSNASSGDTIVLTQSGRYPVQGEMQVKKSITIMALDGLDQRPILINNTEKVIPSFFCIENGGSLKIKGIAFAGYYENKADVQAGIRTSSKPMNLQYNLTIDNCEFYNFNESSFSAFKASKSTYADSLVIRNSIFRNISGTAIDLSSEKEDKGIYNAEHTILENCLFTNVLGSALNIYRGGNDESTTGPFLKVNYCTFNEVDNREQGFVLRLQGVQHALITNSIFNQSGQGGRSIYFQETNKDKLKVDYCNFYRSGRIESFYGKVKGSNIYSFDPKFTDAAKGDFSLPSNSTLVNKSSEGLSLGYKI